MESAAAIYFFPLSEPLPVEVKSVPAGVFARRIPDFICTCLNDDGSEHASLLEIRAADNEGIPTGDWAHFDEMPAPAELFEFLPDPHATRIISGTIRATRPIATGETSDEGESDPRFLDLSLLLMERHGQPEENQIEIRELAWRIDVEDIGASCISLAKKLAAELGLTTPRSNWSKLVTNNSAAFCEFLSGLDGSAQLDPDLIQSSEPKTLLAPFVQALKLDPDFGLSLRRLHVSLHDGVDALMIETGDALALLDEAYSCYPSDSEAASNLGEHLAQVGDDQRAEDWLRLSINQPDPPAQALEALGILLANRGEYAQARNLWRTGVRIDGNPDFFAHLARLAFRDEDNTDGWELFFRGLRRLSERRLHPGEWFDEEGRGGVLLRYLSEHLSEFDGDLPSDVADLGIDDLLLGLVPQIREPEDRLDLGLCLIAIGSTDEGIAAIRAVLPHVEDPDRRDLGAEKVARFLFPDFDEKIEVAALEPQNAEELAASREYFDRVTSEIPQLWPAWYLRGQLEEHVKDWEIARDAYRYASSLRRDQPKIFSRLAVAAAQLQDFDEAIDAIRLALELTPSDAGLHADHALLLHHAGREEAAHDALEVAETLGASNEVVMRVRRIIAPSSSENPSDSDTAD